MYSIGFIMPYFGEFPTWFKFFLKSCEYNPTVNWVFYTDCEIPESYPSNVSFNKASLTDFNALATSKLGFEINLTFAYKICDLRPAFGLIFEEYLNGYDFWGFGDLDLIYGNIRKYCTEEVLSANDILSSRRPFLAGHFTLYKNNDKINNLYSKTAWYQYIFQHPAHKKFDEKHMTTTVKYLAKDVKVSFENWAGSDGAWCLKKWHKQNGWQIDFNEGTVKNKLTNEEYMYFHFFNLKKDNKVEVPNIEIIPSTFQITDKGFVV